MSLVELSSEPFGPMGNLVAEGVWNQLGRPELDRLTLLIRESVQNAWDARTDARITYRLDGVSLRPEQVEAWQSFFRDQPPNAAYRTHGSLDEEIVSVSSWLATPAPRLLVVSDRGTTGLDGPTRADRVEDESKRNFVDFLRNVGQPPQRPQTGGTFGYGKAAFYIASEARTIVVYTRCLREGRLESRLTAAALTHNFTENGARFTGRHWWGRIREGALEPILGDEADALAKAMGLPGFLGTERGTSIAITAPAFDDDELKRLGAVCLRHLWPKLEAPENARPPIALSLTVSGVPVDVPLPSKTPPYDAYWRAYLALRRAEGSDGESKGVQAISYGHEVVGRVSFEHAIMSGPKVNDDDALAHEVSPQHIALLRGPELVVKYLDARKGLGNEHVGFAGVFKAAPEADRHFARSEPPTHDDWQPGSVADKRARGVVTQALKRIREAARAFASLHVTRSTAASGTPLGRLADEFGILAPGVGPSAPPERSRGGKGEPKRRRRGPRPQAKVLEGTEALVENAGVPCAVFSVEVVHAAQSTTTEVDAKAFAVVSGGGREGDAPVGAAAMAAGWWESPRGARIDGGVALVGPRQQGVWRFHVPIEGDVAIGIEVSARAGDQLDEPGAAPDAGGVT